MKAHNHLESVPKRSVAQALTLFGFQNLYCLFKSLSRATKGLLLPSFLHSEDPTIGLKSRPDEDVAHTINEHSSLRLEVVERAGEVYQPKALSSS